MIEQGTVTKEESEGVTTEVLHKRDGDNASSFSEVDGLRVGLVDRVESLVELDGV